MKICEGFTQPNTQIRNLSSKLMKYVAPYPPVMNTVIFLHIQHDKATFLLTILEQQNKNIQIILCFLFHFFLNNNNI